MSSFSDILKRPLPSKLASGTYMEGVECGDACENDDDLANTLADVDATAALDTDDAMQDVADPDPAIDDTPQGEELTPEQDKAVDDTLNTVGTAVLLKDELSNEQECREFVESADCDMAIAEGFVTERTIIKFDKNAKKAQLYEVAIAAVAREKKDPLYKKLQTAYRIERTIKAKLRKKYHAAAMRKVKEYLNRAKKSKSGIIHKIINKITGK